LGKEWSDFDPQRIRSYFLGFRLRCKVSSKSSENCDRRCVDRQTDVTDGSEFIRPPVRSNGRSSVLPVMFFSFFSTRNLRAPSADHRETSPHDRNLCLFLLTPKIRGALPQKIGGQKMQNFGRFYTTVDFDREYLRNGSRHPKSEN